MTTQPKTIDSPLLGATFVAVNRRVLVEMLGRLAWYCVEDELEWQYRQLRDAVAQGRIDVLDAATWKEGVE